MPPIVAIVGRPNVGKSTLFNRIVGSRKAITLDVSGVTRDRHYGPGVWEGREFTLVDTGGFPEKIEGSLEKKIQAQIDTVIEEAAVILFVMDGRQGLLPEEGEIARTLRRSGKKVLYVINKIDSPDHEEKLADFYQLGDAIYPISAEHGYRVNDLLDQVVASLPPSEEPSKNEKQICIALIGRPNVGKSSLVNRLLGEERVIVHDQPGTTRDAIDTAIRVSSQDYLLIDTAGIRRRALSASKVERYSVLNALKVVERADVCLLLLDAKEGIHNQDAHVAGHISKARKGMILIWNKWDLVRREKGIQKKLKEQVDDNLPFASHSDTLHISALSGEGCGQLWTTINKLYRVSGQRISTHKVNEAFERLTGSHNPPVYRGKPVKFYYATQTGTFPPTFIIFVSDPKGVHFSFKRYLVNSFREIFNFGGAPIELLFRRKRK